MASKQEDLRHLPSVTSLLKTAALSEAAHSYPHWALVQGCRDAIERLRRGEGSLETNEARKPGWREELGEGIAHEVIQIASYSLRTVINATGVVLHTNLGRALLSKRAIEHVVSAASHYTNLELDLSTGKRGSRYKHVHELLCALTGAEDAIVVNNNAAAVILSLSGLASGREVVISRGELVEIGGSFRIPEIMKLSGCVLREVGTTNRTHLRDYEDVLNENTALLLKVHTSNYEIRGFTTAVEVPELKTLAAKVGLPVIHDLGAGCFVDLSEYGLPKEPTVREAIADGADIVTFSGDKLLGGPQMGVIAGREALIAKLKHHQLLRALRVDKLSLAAMEATLRAYRDLKNPAEELPVLAMLATPTEVINSRAYALMSALKEPLAGRCSMRILKDSSRVGAGASPESRLETRVLALAPKTSVVALEERLRSQSPAVMARVSDGELWLDLRTVLEHEMEPLQAALVGALTASSAD